MLVQKVIIADSAGQMCNLAIEKVVVHWEEEDAGLGQLEKKPQIGNCPAQHFV